MEASKETPVSGSIEGTSFRMMEEFELEPASQLFARAFFEDPISRYLFPDENTRLHHLKAVFQPYLRYGIRFGQVQAPLGELQAGAMWLGPDECHMTAERSSLVGFDELSDQLGGEAMERFDEYFTWMEEVHEREAPARHLYLAVLAVDTLKQGRGVGSSLIGNMTTRADEEGLPCYLETQQPRNVPLYLRHGFEVLVDTVEPVSRVRTWTFLRQPR